MKNNYKNYKIIKYLVFSIIILIIIIILISIYGLKGIFYLIKNANYTAVASIVSIIALIYTIIKSKKEQTKIIESLIRSDNQIKFEKELYNILDTYNMLIIDISLLKIEFDRKNNNNFILPECISNWTDCTIKYSYLLDDMETKMYYLYKYNSFPNHYMYDKLVKDIQGINQSLKIELTNYSKLSTKASNINLKYSMYCQDKTIDFEAISNECKDIIFEAKNIIIEISNIINNKKSIIYDEALECIKERELIIKENEI